MNNYEIERDESIERIEKLLKAFVDASGYEIEEVITIEHAHRIDGPDSWIEDIEHIDYKVTEIEQPPFERIPVNYKELLNKYIEHVSSCEGETFISEYHTDDSNFTDIEIKVLRGEI